AHDNRTSPGDVPDPRRARAHGCRPIRACRSESSPPHEAARMTPLRIVLVDDHRVVTRSLKAWLESFSDMEVVGVAANGEEALAHIDAWRPDVVIQDLLLPGGIDGIETTRRLCERLPSVKVIALTAS